MFTNTEELCVWLVCSLCVMMSQCRHVKHQSCGRHTTSSAVSRLTHTEEGGTDLCGRSRPGTDPAPSLKLQCDAAARTGWGSNTEETLPASPRQYFRGESL